MIGPVYVLWFVVLTSDRVSVQFNPAGRTFKPVDFDKIGSQLLSFRNYNDVGRQAEAETKSIRCTNYSKIGKIGLLRIRFFNLSTCCQPCSCDQPLMDQSHDHLLMLICRQSMGHSRLLAITEPVRVTD